MSGLNLSRLEQYRGEILKAEIGALLFNLGKTHIGFGFWRNYFSHKSSEFKFSSYKEYAERYFYSELEEISPQLKNFFEKININLDFWNTQFLELLKGGESGDDFVKKIFFRGCENINSGIDKGSPNEQLKPPLWLSNAFGSFKEEIKESNFDEKRKKFFINLYKCLKKQGYSSETSNIDWTLVRNYIFKKIKRWYSHLLSDSRFPVNDVSLYDQAYMTASMFKAGLSQLVMDGSKLNDYQNNPSSIKWRILGIQYDKVGIAEKSLKLASISWYREITKKIDEEIKNLLEIEYPIGNEVYRDETGIYFIVGEDLGKDLENGNLAEFKLKDLEEKILEIFKELTDDEFYPTIFLTKASRGLMNLSTLLENAKENFLKTNWKKKNISLSLVNPVKGKAIGICPICQVRLIYEEDKQKQDKTTFCEVCDDRIHHKQVSRWIDNLTGETIWIDEVKDKNNRITYISLKFELEDWLNGNLLNSLIANRNEFFKLFEDVKFSILSEKELSKNLQNLFKSYFKIIPLNNNIHNNLSIDGKLLSNYLPDNERKNVGKIIAVFNNLNNQHLYKEFNDYINKVKKQIEISLPESLGFFEALKKIVELLISDSYIKEFENFLKDERNGFGKLDENIQFLQRYQSIPVIKKLIAEIYVYKKYIDLAKRILKKEDRRLSELKSLAINFVPFSISEEILNYYHQYETLKNFYQHLFLFSITGTQWEEWIKTTPLNSKIDWDNEKIKWEEFNDENDPALDLLATLLLQFLLRKNPSPARLRRIWETTREFFEEIHKELDTILDIPEWRKKRLVWEVELDGENKLEKSMELEENGLLFWAEKEENKIYLISSIQDFLEKFGNEKIKTALKKIYEKSIKPEEYEKNLNLLNESFSNVANLKNYLNNKKITLKPYEEKENEKNKIEFDIKENLENIITYKPFTSITDPSPVNYQVIIPAEYLPNLIDKVLEKYNKEFKYVYGKLPIHIGVVISDYQKPLYINLKALRRIRRDVKEINKLYENKPLGEFCILQKQKLALAKEKEKINNTEEYYSLYWDNSERKDYNFYIKPENGWKKWISTVDKFDTNEEVQIIPNTFDFEYLDHNIRRNEIFYDEKGKRVTSLKRNRPYELEVYWRKFKAFKELFTQTNLQTSRLHKLIEILYSKVQYEESFNEDYSYLFASSFINWLELNKKENIERRKLIKKIFDLQADPETLSEDFRKELTEKLKNKENILLFIDMFEFWHTALKEV